MRWNGTHNRASTCGTITRSSGGRSSFTRRVSSSHAQIVCARISTSHGEPASIGRPSRTAASSSSEYRVIPSTRSAAGTM